MAGKAKSVAKATKSKTANPSDWLAKAHVLTEALPFMQLYDKKTVVVKYGGHAMGDDTLAKQFAHDVVLLKQAGINPVIVHGGGPQIAAMLARLGIKSSFKNGLRVTDAQTIEVVEMVLAGAINKKIVTALNAAGGTAVGLSGKDGDLLVAKKTPQQNQKPDLKYRKSGQFGFCRHADPSQYGYFRCHAGLGYYSGDCADCHISQWADIKCECRYGSRSNCRRA